MADKIPRTAPHLFDEKTERWTEKGNKISSEFYDAIKPVFDKYYAEGFRARELAHLLQGTCVEIELLTVI